MWWIVIGILWVVPAYAEITLLEKNRWRVTTLGFVEMDITHDSTQSYRDIIGNGPVSRSDVYAGEHDRMQLSIRNSRLGFAFEAPVYEGWKTRGMLEFDFLGYNPGPGPNNTEGFIFNNPTVRIRHAYFHAEKGPWQILAGQYWSLLGWQTNYYIDSVTVAPLPGYFYQRQAQVRVTRKFALSEEQALQAACALSRPPEGDAGLPDFQSGLRWSYGGWQSGYVGGSSAPVQRQPLSFGISGAIRQFIVPTISPDPKDVSKPTGSVVIFDGFIPVLADESEARGTLSLVGEFSTGKGYGDQLPGLTGNMASPLSTANTTSGVYQTLHANGKMPSLDAGLGDYDSAGNFHLLELRTTSVHLQYHLPFETPQWLNVGSTWLELVNMDRLLPFGPGTRTSDNRIPYDRMNTYFANYYRQMTPQVRLGVELSRIETHYGDGLTAANHRFQVSSWFLF